MKNIVVVGSCMIDFICYSNKLPKAGETILGEKFETGFGGKGANQCAAVAKLGGKTSFVTRLGEDSWGKDYLNTLKNLNVDISHVHLTPNETTGIAQIVVDKQGQNQIVVVGGANCKLSVNDIENANKTISNAAVLVCQLETSPEVALHAIQLCKGVSILNGAPGIANCNPLLLTAPTIFCVNETEAAVFTGLPVESLSEAKEAVKNLLERGCKTVILTLGAEGALFSSCSSEVIHVQAIKVCAVDCTGAGDAFIGALAFLISEYSDIGLEKQIKIACNMAACSITKPGTQISFPEKNDLEKCLVEHQIKL